MEYFDYFDEQRIISGECSPEDILDERRKERELDSETKEEAKK